MKISLPSTAHLEAFEASARHLSLTEAARELGLTQAAVSLRVQALEERLGVKLFERHKRLELTEIGQIFLPAASEVLDRLEKGVARLANHRNSSLRLLVTQAVASQWLIPRLGAFCERHSDVSVSLVSVVRSNTSIDSRDFAWHNVDAAIVNTAKDTIWHGLVAEEIISDYAIPVFSTSLAGRAPSDVADLSSHTLIHNDRWPQAWRQWLTFVGAPDLEPKSELWFQHSGLSVQAAMSGLGCAIAHGPLVADDILGGRLLAPFKKFLPVQFTYFVVRPTHKRSAAVSHFVSWFREEITRSMETLRERDFSIPATA